MTAERRRYDPADDRPIHQVRSDGRIVGEIRVDTPIFVISVAADLAGMHAQTLRSYDRDGLVSPRRASGGGRRYSPRDIERLQQVQQLSQDEGVNRAGIRRIMELENEVDALRSQVEDIAAELEAARAALAAGLRPADGQHHAGGAAPGARRGVLDGTVVVAPGDAVVPWRSHTTAIVTWRPGR